MTWGGSVNQGGGSLFFRVLVSGGYCNPFQYAFFNTEHFLFSFVFELLSFAIFFCAYGAIRRNETFFFQFFYTTNPTERSTSKIFRSTSEIVLESSVESQQALAECSPSNDRACVSSAHRALDGILQTIIRQFRSSSEKTCSSSAPWDQWCKHYVFIVMNYIYGIIILHKLINSLKAFRQYRTTWIFKAGSAQLPAFWSGIGIGIIMVWEKRK